MSSADHLGIGQTVMEVGRVDESVRRSGLAVDRRLLPHRRQGNNLIQIGIRLKAYFHGRVVDMRRRASASF